MKNIFEKINTFQKALLDEIQEAFDEIKKNNSVYLEDELGDILWTYITLLHSLKDEGLITSTQAVMERCFNKFSGRIDYLHKNSDSNECWAEIRAKQKNERKEEHNEKYGK